jgi:hypothetical protein
MSAIFGFIETSECHSSFLRCVTAYMYALLQRQQEIPPT